LKQAVRSYHGFVPLLAALCACSGASAPRAIDMAPQRFSTSVAREPIPSRPDHHRSWISPELARATAPVLFVSDPGTADVYIYSLSTLKLKGTITGFDQPQGECSDNKGNVWVTDTNGQTIYELSHGGQLENALSDSVGYPDACAWDPTTKNLAVMSLFGVGSSSGDVLIYPKGSGSPTSYANPSQYFYNFGGYDTAGNLYFDGRDASGTFMLSELPRGAHSAYTIKLSGGTIYFPGMVQWDSSNNNLIVGDQSCANNYASCIYQVTVSQKTGTIKKQIKLQDYAGSQACDLVQGVKYNNQVAGSDYDFCAHATSATYLWTYPTGGAPKLYNKTTDVTPVGAAISI
jgi:hypothetical protein